MGAPTETKVSIPCEHLLSGPGTQDPLLQTPHFLSVFSEVLALTPGCPLTHQFPVPSQREAVFSSTFQPSGARRRGEHPPGSPLPSPVFIPAPSQALPPWTSTSKDFISYHCPCCRVTQMHPGLHPSFIADLTDPSPCLPLTPMLSPFG